MTTVDSAISKMVKKPLDKTTLKACAQVIEALVGLQVSRATKYLSPTLVVRAKRRAYKNKLDGRDKTIEIVLVIGKPNYAQREFIKDCQKAGEPFPVKHVIIKHFPTPRKKVTSKKKRA